MTRQARIFCILTTAVVIVTGLALQAQAPQRTGTAAGAPHSAKTAPTYVPPKTGGKKT